MEKHPPYWEAPKLRRFYAASHFTVQQFSRAKWGLKIYGIDNARQEGGVLYTANHRNWKDPFIFPASIPDRHVTMVARHTLLNTFALGSLLKAWNAVPVHREEDWENGRPETREELQIALDEMDAIVEVARSGRAVGMFQEGTRDKSRVKAPDKADMGEFKPGVAKVAKKARVATVPGILVGTDQLINGKMGIGFGEPIEQPTGKTQVWLGELRDRTEQLYEQVYEELLAA